MLGVAFFLLNCIPDKVCLDARHCEIYLVDSSYFHILIYMLEVSSGMSLRHSEAVLSFQALFFSLVNRTVAAFSVGLIFSSSSAKFFLCTLMLCEL